MYVNTPRKDRWNKGNAFIEYFVLATIVALATIWFFDSGNFQGVRQTTENSFTAMISRVAR